MHIKHRKLQYKHVYVQLREYRHHNSLRKTSQLFTGICIKPGAYRSMPALPLCGSMTSTFRFVPTSIIAAMACSGYIPLFNLLKLSFVDVFLFFFIVRICVAVLRRRMLLLVFPLYWNCAIGVALKSIFFIQ